jgi:CRP-like cAMP-binding protein
MQLPDRARFLAGIDPFDRVPVGVLDAIAEDMDFRVLEAGEVLFEEGSVGDAAYVVVDGELSLRVGGVELLRRGAGSFVGEFSLIDAQPRSTAGIAHESLAVLCWQRESFLRVLAADPAVAQAMLRLLTGKLRSDVGRRVKLIVERTRWRQDLQRSREIQAGMLPPTTVRVGGLEVAGHCAPAGEVGGDFYDVLALPGGGLGVLIVDVTGHGFYSALFAAMAKAGLHAQARVDPSPTAVMDAMRRTLALSLERRMLMTCAYLELDPGARRLRYANAGHPHPLLYRAGDGRVQALEVLDPILGALEPEECAYQAREIPWDAGDRLVLYSDGVIEARDRAGREYGRERLEDALLGHHGLGASALCEALAHDVQAHRGGGPPADDLTLVVIAAAGGQAP